MTTPEPRADRPAGVYPKATDFYGYAAQTERLSLRPYAFEDFEPFLDLHRREEVARYLPWEPRDEADCRRALGRHQTTRLESDGDGLTLAAFDQATGRLVGEFVLFLRDVRNGGGELGYVLHPEFQGRGLATEGSRRLLDIAFDDLGLHRVVARVDARNTASAAVLRRLGMRHEAHLVRNELFKGEWGDEDRFAILGEEWNARSDRLSDGGAG